MSIKALSNFIDSELDTDLQEVLFTKDNQGKYYLFGKYVIVRLNNLYKVYCLDTRNKVDFLSLKNATAWCVLRNSGDNQGASRIHNLDLKLSSIDIDIAVHKNKIKNAKSNFGTLISITKLQEDTYKRRWLVSELSHYINQSKRIQNNKFNAKDSKIRNQR
jgi:hypothetical protein